MFEYVFAWRNYPKTCNGATTFWQPWVEAFGNKRAEIYGKRLRVLARGAKNSALVEFENGQREIVSRNAIRRLSRRDKISAIGGSDEGK